MAVVSRSSVCRGIMPEVRENGHPAAREGELFPLVSAAETDIISRRLAPAEA
jgi:hypothetical protein